MGSEMIDNNHWGKILKTEDPEEALHQINAFISGKKIFTTSFSKEDQIIAYLIAINNLDIEIITLDTGRHFEETYQLHHNTEEWLGIKIKAFHPNPKNLESLYAIQGPNGFYSSVANRQKCCEVRKSLPLKEALKDVKVWITGLRASQSELRNSMKIWEQDDEKNRIKYNPIFKWSDNQVDLFIKQKDIPINPLYNQGYTSIGCAPCTRPIKPGEHTRAGRWWWEESKKECGLHLK
jgi:phosphoadenosine phosphosulfate reductase